MRRDDVARTGGPLPGASIGAGLGVTARCLAVARLALLALLLAVLMPVAGAFAQISDPKFPALTGQIVDEAGLLSQADRSEILTTLQGLEGKSTDQLVVVTLKSLQDRAIEDFGIRLARHWKIGQAGTNNGIVLIVAPNERKVRIEVGRGLEGQMTDAMSSLIIQNAILPAFRRGDFAGGIKAGVRDIRDVLLGDAEAVKDRASRMRKRSEQADPEAIIFMLIWLAIFAFVIYRAYQQAKYAQQQVGQPGSRQGPGRRNRGPDIIVIPGGWGGSGNWGGGDSGGGWSGGGGGDFGGGGSSGSW